ncbi:MAG: hypothetical protein JNN00_19350 [Chitinophagaceae bacterium]|nr:hypothetical protein [Chitinophagaceae bacterium]
MYIVAKLWATTSDITPEKSKEFDRQERNPQIENVLVDGDAKGFDGGKKTQRESYSIGLSCKKGSWQPPHLAATECLTTAENIQLTDIIVKLLNRGVMLDITYTPISEILGRPYVSKPESS